MAAGRSSARASVLRSALLFSPFLAVSSFALAYILADATNKDWDAGHMVGLAVVGFVTLLLGYQVVRSIRDLFSECVETIGVVDRWWSRLELMLFRNDYVFVKDNVFRLDRDEYIGIN